MLLLHDSSSGGISGCLSSYSGPAFRRGYGFEGSARKMLHVFTCGGKASNILRYVLLGGDIAELWRCLPKRLAPSLADRQYQRRRRPPCNFVHSVAARALDEAMVYI